MNRGLIATFVFTCVLILGCLTVVYPAYGQKPGLSAKGGSIARGRTESTRSINKKDPMFYRRIVRALGFDFADLKETYHQARVRNPNLDFPTLLKGHIAVEVKAAHDADLATQQLLEALETSHNKLPSAFQKVFSLTSFEAKQLEKTVNEQYKECSARCFHLSIVFGGAVT